MKKVEEKCEFNIPNEITHTSVNFNIDDENHEYEYEYGIDLCNGIEYSHTSVNFKEKLE